MQEVFLHFEILGLLHCSNANKAEQAQDAGGTGTREGDGAAQQEAQGRPAFHSGLALPDEVVASGARDCSPKETAGSFRADCGWSKALQADCEKLQQSGQRYDELWLQHDVVHWLHGNVRLFWSEKEQKDAMLNPAKSKQLTLSQEKKQN